MSGNGKKKSLQKRLAKFMNHTATEIVVLLLILISVVLVLVEFSLDPASVTFKQVEAANDLITVLFIIELGLRFFAEQRKKRFFKKYWLDILAVFPLFRSFRILRVFRLLRLFRFGVVISRRLMRVSGTLRVVKLEYVVIALTIMMVIIMGAFSMRMAEGRVNVDFNSVEKAMWFAIMTVIGGEPIGGTPKTRLGNFITVTLMMGGLTVFAIFTGTISAVMVNSLRSLKFRTMELDDLENHVIICGWNRAGRLMIEELLHDRKRFKHLVVISEDETLGQTTFFEHWADNIYVIQGDYTRVSVLHEAGVERASFAMLLADDTKEERSSQDRDARTVLAAMLIEKLNKNIYTVVQLLNRDNETSLRKVGVEEIIVSDEYVGNIMATVAKNRGIVNILDELLTAKYGHQFFKEEVPDALVGKSIAEAVGILKANYDATLIGVDLMEGDSHTETICVNPPAELILKKSHRIIVAASNALVKKA